jgi:hypothetical protein
VALALAAAAAAVIGLRLWQVRQAERASGAGAELSVLAGVRVEHLLAPSDVDELARRLGAWPGPDFDVTANGHVVLRAGDALFEVASDARGVLAERLLAGDAPEHFALDGGTDLLGVRGRFLGALDEDGTLPDAVPLPVTGMRVAAAATKGALHLFGGTPEVARRVYTLREDGALDIAAELPDPVVAVAEGRRCLYLATADEVWRLRDESLELVLRFAPDDPPLTSIAVTPDERLLFLAQAGRVYVAHGVVLLALVRDAGGELRLRDDALWLWSAERRLLARLPQIETALLAGSAR